MSPLYIVTSELDMVIIGIWVGEIYIYFDIQVWSSMNYSPNWFLLLLLFLENSFSVGEEINIGNSSIMVMAINYETASYI